MSQMNLTAVLKVMNDLADNTAAAVCGHCCIKVNCAMGAVGTCEHGRNSAIEGFGALLTKRRDDTHGFCFALLAEIFASPSLAATQGAYRRGKKRNPPLRPIKISKSEQNLPHPQYYPKEGGATKQGETHPPNIFHPRKARH